MAYEIFTKYYMPGDGWWVWRGGGGGESNSLYFVWYRRAAGIDPILQVIYTCTLIGHNSVSNNNNNKNNNFISRGQHIWHECQSDI